MNINSAVELLKGVGPKAKDSLNRCGVFTVLDLLLYFPRDYENLIATSEDTGLLFNCKSIINCKVVEIKKDNRTSDGKIITTIVFSQGENIIYGKWFNQPYMKNNFKISEEYQLIGTIKKYKNQNMISSPKVVKNTNSELTIVPKYSVTKDITASLIGKLISQTLNNIIIKENLPMYLVTKYNLCSLDEAIRNIHYPENNDKLNRAITRLKFQELFAYSMKILMFKNYGKTNNNGIAFKMSEELSDLKNCLPYNLTNAQSKTVRDILLDQKKPSPMNRLVQGDVGSGKTIVAIIAIFNIIKNGFQAVMMAPTEILANQHYSEAIKILDKFQFTIKLLTGSTAMKEKKIIKEQLEAGEIDIIIGTHALIEEDVKFKNLGMVVTDEQHRFGVYQRAQLFNKNSRADVLVMTATPIPRTLSLYLYGDLDISIIDELPPGRKPIETSFIEEKDKAVAYKHALMEIEKGRQVYIVCPLVEDKEESKLNSVEKLNIVLKEKYFKDYNVEILHGKMSPKDKDDIMTRFKAGDIQVLISTTVIEVGVNVPNASIMIIENAERFGLSQLHQLRGRVGRGEHKSFCMLIGNCKNTVTRKRMETMVSSNDGFYIAEQDLKLRGSGEMFGMRQSGENGLILSDIIEDINIFKAANMEAKYLLENKDEEFINIKNEIFFNLKSSKKYICFN